MGNVTKHVHKKDKRYDEVLSHSIGSRLALKIIISVPYLMT
jgi:hypothetical protein